MIAVAVKVSVAVEVAVGISIEVVAERIPIEVVAVGIPIEIVAVVHRHVSAGLSSNITPTTSLSIEGSLPIFPSIPVTA